MVNYIKVDGTTISASELQIEKAKLFAQAVTYQDYAVLSECVRDAEGQEVVVLDVEVEIPQQKVHDIRNLERIAVRFDPNDETVPETLALRADFPEVPHLNIRQNILPRSLCLYEEHYSEVKRYWTGALHIQIIRSWLALTAKGQLHAEDQPLEPLLMGSEGILVLPSEVLDLEKPVPVLVVDRTIETGHKRTFVAKVADQLAAKAGKPNILVMVIPTKTQKHGIIFSRPSSLYELHKFLERGEIDLLTFLRKQLKFWKDDASFKTLENARLIILVMLPKSRTDDKSDYESIEQRAFFLDHSIIDIGVGIGIWGLFNGNVGDLLPIDDLKVGEQISVSMLNPVFSLSSRLASLINGFDNTKEIKIVTVGVGALGSQVILNLVRMGYGKWVIVDDDVLLPHNLARHALSMNLVGRSKAFGLAAMADQIIDDENLVTYIEENVLYPSQPQKLEVAFSEAQVILDASTSIAAARYLTYDIQSAARRISMFLNPTATAVVILAEDCERLVKLDMLEMQYYRGLLEEPNLEKHLDQGDERVRYGTSCRDLSSKIPQDLVALHSAISSRALRGVIDDRNASTTIWSTDLENITTSKYAIPVGTVREIILGDWTLKTDSIFLEKVTQLRAGKLPNETGGVLIGSYDTDRKIVFVIDTIPAPPDSVEWPTVFIRGSEGLRKGVERVRQITKNQLDYVGEWHSHPDGIGSKPSTDDMKAFSWLSSLMAQDGLPGLMLIVADCQCDFYLGKMEA